ncbi:hypothetical protein [Haloarcula nitratireducens]|uniref:Uncharacterized protein n=1 Tax=Haloarcula nitratireducens TaxID=2487749 RepID=A0AAW4PC69_9EURY|nr:hypothetical protein [Halomicroarcula nitratireducens]MBX0295327.1 hypothetical protein [Halomicroarcula nitratireducens]
MSSELHALARDTEASETAEKIDVTLEFAIEELGIGELVDNDDLPPVERVALDPESGTGDEVGVVVECRLDGIDAGSVFQLVAESQHAQRLVFDDRAGTEGTDVSLEGRSDGGAPLFDSCLGEDAAFDRLAFDFQSEDDAVLVTLRGLIDGERSALTDFGDDLQQIVFEP